MISCTMRPEKMRTSTIYGPCTPLHVNLLLGDPQRFSCCIGDIGTDSGPTSPFKLPGGIN